MLTVDAALRLVSEHAKPLAPRRLPLGEAAGLVLAEDVTSEVNSPPYDKSLMDGYAVQSSDHQAVRRILEEVAAGAVPRYSVTPGTTTRIMTGAPLPEGADAVVPFEKTELIDATSVRLQHVDPAPGQNILRLGASLRAGDVVLHDGTPLRPIEIAILAEIGHVVVSVCPRPRVAVLPTGNEIVPVSELPGPGQIRNSNGPMLLAAAARAGAEAIDLGIGRDDRAELQRLIDHGLAADVLVLSGGVSAGAFDLVPEVLAESGVEQVFHKVALRPGKPLWFGVKHFDQRRVLVFGLPGNPVSSFVCFELFVRPALSALAGRGFRGAAFASATLSHDFQYKESRESWLPGRLSWPADNGHWPQDVHQDGEPPSVEILPWQGSADMATLCRANALVRLPSETAWLAAGTAVHVICL
jgi:molybdopterin molybdotransferase